MFIHEGEHIQKGREEKTEQTVRKRSKCCAVYFRELLGTMSLREHSEEILLWRKVHLSRAKLKAISQTSAFMAGFAMVSERDPSTLRFYIAIGYFSTAYQCCPMARYAFDSYSSENETFIVL